MKKSVLLLKSGLMLILCWLASLVITMFFPTCYMRFGAVMCFLFGICSVGAVICIYGDFTWKLGKKMSLYDERNGLKDNSLFGLALGAVPTILNYIFAIPVFLSKSGILSFDAYPLYKTLTLYFLPWTYLTAPNTAEKINGVVMSVTVPASQLSAAALVVIAILPLVFLATCYIGFAIGYRHIDVKEKILYGK